MFKTLHVCAIILLSSMAVKAQNVGVGTNQPAQKLHVNGNIRSDGAQIVNPVSETAAATISISNTTGMLIITNASGVQANVASMSGTPANGQRLIVVNQDDDKATFASHNVAAGAVLEFLYDGSSWKTASSTAVVITDTDGDTKIQVEESNDDDVIRFDVGGTEAWKMVGNRLEASGSNLAIGQNALLSNTTGNKNTSIGLYTLSNNTTGFDNVALGYNATNRNTSGSRNTAIGAGSLQFNTTGKHNTGLGAYSLWLNTTGSDNVAIGYLSLYSNLGSSNLAMGNSSLLNNTTGSNNTAVGSNALKSNTTASGNVAVGERALEDNTTGYRNTGIGQASLVNNTTGYSNTGIGSEVMASNTTGRNNTAIGVFTLYDNTTGRDNAAFGNNSLGNNTEGVANVAVGYDGLNRNTTGDYNTAVGYQAGYLGQTAGRNLFLGYQAGYRTTGSRNIMIGYQAGYYETGSDKLYIDNTSTNSPLVYGDFSSNLLKVNGTINVNGAYNMPTNSGSSGQVLTTNGSGTASWTSISAGTDDQTVDKFSLSGTTLSLSLENDGANDYIVNLSSLNTTKTLISDTDNDTKIQVEKNTDEDFIRFDVAGSEKWRMTGTRLEAISASNNMFIGFDAGKNTSTGSQNVALGKFAFVDNTSGENNVALGNYALRKNTSGDYNIAVGVNALNLNTTGEGNLALGYEALEVNTTGSYNTALGFRSLFVNTTGARNVAIGQQTLYANTEGLQNISIGHRSGYKTTTGDNNIYLGFEAGYDNQTGNGNIMIGFKAGYNETGSDKLYIDNSNTSSPLIHGDFNTNQLTFNGNVAINGTTLSLKSSSSNMDIRMADNNGNLDRVMAREYSSNDVYIGDIEANGGDLYLRANGSNRVIIASSGNMVTHTIYPTANNSHSLGLSSNRWTAVYATNGTIQTSDLRFKKNIEDMAYGLDELMQFRSVSYQWKQDSTGATKLGFIAQELEQVVPEVVTIGTDSLQTRGVNYAELVPVLVKAIQEQQDVIANLEDTVSLLENQKANLTEQVSANTADLEAIRALLGGLAKAE